MKTALLFFVFGVLFTIVSSQNCPDAPCVHGTCLNQQACNCQGTGWAGQHCEIAVCDTPCQHGGICSQPNTCDCSGIGYTGAYCQTPICDSPCQNGGFCSGHNTCNCTATGYAGALCEVAICDPTCKAGSCDRPNYCNCTGTGFKGALCDQFTCENPCQHGGQCVGPNLCSCNGTGYDSNVCQIPICDPGCQNGGVCTAPNTCDCSQTGWDGDLCEIPICDEIDCLHNSTCTGHNVCDCQGTGWIGTNCNIDIDECAQKGVTLCQSGVKCVNTNGSYSCPCPPGYSGQRRISGLPDMTTCAPICSQACQQNTTCIAPNTCNCTRTGYTGSYCETDIDECASSMNGKYCSQVANCTNTPGSYICGDCPNWPFPGYLGNANTGLGGNGCQALCNPPCADGLYCVKPNTCSEIPKDSSSLELKGCLMAVLALAILFV